MKPRRSAIVLASLLAAVSAGGAAAQTGGTGVTVTLVRWPYT
jgi:hypothetical protein